MSDEAVRLTAFTVRKYDIDFLGQRLGKGGARDREQAGDPPYSPLLYPLPANERCASLHCQKLHY